MHIMRDSLDQKHYRTYFYHLFGVNPNREWAQLSVPYWIKSFSVQFAEMLNSISLT